ncbi:MAG: hypothetical protein ACP5XB_01655 [Isosphaeraceae bacterium]
MDIRKQYLDVAELAARVARYDRSAGEVACAAVAEHIAALDDQNWGLGNEGPAIFRAAGTFDPRIARAMLDSLPEDPPPPPTTGVITPRPHHQSKAQARLALAEILALPPAIRFQQPFLATDTSWHGSFQVMEGKVQRVVD